MRKLTALGSVFIFLLSLGGHAYGGEPQSSLAEYPGGASDIPLPLNNTWVVRDQFIGDCPAFFPETFIFTSADPVYLRVADLFVIGDSYNVYDNGELLFTSVCSDDWKELGFPNPFNPPYTADPEWVWSQRDAFFAKGYKTLSPGTHRITIQAIERPTDFTDSTVAISVRPVPRLDVKPGAFPNVINPDARGILPVALLGSFNVDVKDVDTDFPLHLGGASPMRQLIQDVNGDGYPDLVLHYRLEETGIKPGDTSISLLGKMHGFNSSWEWFTVSDSIETKPKKKEGIAEPQEERSRAAKPIRAFAPQR